jgi:hypothetical protein
MLEAVHRCEDEGGAQPAVRRGVDRIDRGLDSSIGDS